MIWRVRREAWVDAKTATEALARIQLNEGPAVETHATAVYEAPDDARPLWLDKQDADDLFRLLREALTAPHATTSFELRRRGAILQQRVLPMIEEAHAGDYVGGHQDLAGEG